MSASSYQPNADAFAFGLDSVKLLSQRDLAVRVPINFVPVAGASVARVCSIAGQYESSTFAKCISNLLVLGFRRFDLDLYWDETRVQWSFCPVQLGNQNQVPSSTSSPSITRSSMPTTLQSATLFEARQMTTTSSESTASTTTNTMTTLANSAAATASSNAPLRFGQYTCSPTVDISLFVNILVEFLDDTETNLNATTTYLNLNLHAAAPQSNPSVPTTPNRLPTSEHFLSSLISLNTSTYLYTPSDLQLQRADLNASWFGIPQNLVPDAGYFNEVRTGNTYTVADGWPSDSFIEFTKAKRLLVGFGEIKPEIRQYNITVDRNIIFQPSILDDLRSYQISAGSVQSGCIYNPSTTALANVNNSWAIAGVQSTDAAVAANYSTLLTGCGMSPLLNNTLGNITAAQSLNEYRQFVLGTIWSWDVDEPRDHPNSSQTYHCAVLNATSGRWQVDSCSSNHYCACRVNDEPYDWRISTSQLSYDRVDQGCDESTFTVARTAMENNYLLKAWRDNRASNQVDDELLFLNFNDLDQASCWVIGQNSTCPYKDNDNSNAEITVPTVAAVIVFVLTILTIFVKCAANRQNTRRRRKRGQDGWDYEGIPA